MDFPLIPTLLAFDSSTRQRECLLRVCTSVADVDVRVTSQSELG